MSDYALSYVKLINFLFQKPSGWFYFVALVRTKCFKANLCNFKSSQNLDSGAQWSDYTKVYRKLRVFL